MYLEPYEALYYEKLEHKELICRLCPHNCQLKVGQRGFCRSRSNIDGTLIATNYRKCVAIAEDNIEKKPLYHYFPGTQILSLGPNSCNLLCNFCQNYRISILDAPTKFLDEFSLNELALFCTPQHPQLAFTYSEPLTWYEYIKETAEFNPELAIVLVTNAFLNIEPFQDLLPYISALNIDLKAMNNDFYKEQCKGRLAPVLDNIRFAYEAGKHLEITLLLIEGLNNADAEISALAGFIGELSPDIPLHISAYHPAFRMSLPATSQAAIERAIYIAKEHLNFVYGGNLRTQNYIQTYCPVCDALVIERSYEGGRSFLVDDNKCPKCGHTIYGVFA
ncbi:MAG: AmmeMemoRadiSam system radical SAM enzyme [Candidatus Cloacimonadaceae bacterium]